MDNFKPNKQPCRICKDHKPRAPFKIRDDDGKLFSTMFISNCPYCGRFLAENYTNAAPPVDAGEDNKPKVVTLCGSTKFKDEFIKAQKDFTLRGYIVLSVGFFGHADNEFGTTITEEIKIMLDELHKRKIDLSDEIYVINKDGYIGSSTKSEIKYAKSHDIKITYMEGCPYGN